MLKDNHILIRNCNYKLRGNEVVFSIGDIHTSRRAITTLSYSSLQLLNTIDGVKSIAAYCEAFSQNKINVQDIIQEWYELGIVEIVSPLKKNDSHHLVVIEPHMDDAALSVGGTLLKNKGNQKVSIVSVIGQSNYTSYSGVKDFSVELVSKIRREESAIACRMLHAEHVCLNELDQPIRWKNNNETDLGVQSEIERMAEVLAEAVLPMSPTEIWIPLAFEFHADHHRVRDAAIEMLHRYSKQLSGVTIKMYEDQPYSTRYSDELKKKLLQKLYGVKDLPEPIENDIADFFSEKIRVISVFGSQFKGTLMEPALKKAALQAANKYELSERLWSFEKVPNRIDFRFWEQLDKMDDLLDILKQEKHIEIYKYDWFVEYDFQKFLELFPGLTVTLHLPTRERQRSKLLNSSRVNVHFHPDGFDSLIEVMKKSANEPGVQSPSIVITPDVQWPARMEIIERFSDYGFQYKSCWFSTLLMAIMESLEVSEIKEH